MLEIIGVLGPNGAARTTLRKVASSRGSSPGRSASAPSSNASSWWPRPDSARPSTSRPAPGRPRLEVAGRQGRACAPGVLGEALDLVGGEAER
jgi:hypothetical protein